MCCCKRAVCCCCCCRGCTPCGSNGCCSSCSSCSSNGDGSGGGGDCSSSGSGGGGGGGDCCCCCCCCTLRARCELPRWLSPLLSDMSLELLPLPRGPPGAPCSSPDEHKPWSPSLSLLTAPAAAAAAAAIVDDGCAARPLAAVRFACCPCRSWMADSWLRSCCR